MDVPDVAVQMLERLCQHCADEYEAMLALGVPRDYARKCLPLATASKMRMGGNLRTWMEMLPKRLGRTAHAEVREVSRNILGILKARFKGVFDHIEEE
jgi:thymidylate synthase ThyX